MLVDWLTDIGMIQAGPLAALDTWIGWYEPYATSHDDLDDDSRLVHPDRARGAQPRGDVRADPLRRLPGAERRAPQPAREVGPGCTVVSSRLPRSGHRGPAELVLPLSLQRNGHCILLS